MNSTRSVGRRLLTLFSLLTAVAVRAAISAEWDWAAASPESQGMLTSRLEALWADLQGRRTKALLITRNDRIVFERYATNHTRSAKHYSASMAKALAGGVSLAIALNDAQMALEDLASKHVPQWADDAAKSKITIRHLGSHTSGLADAEEGGMPHDKLTGWKGDFWKRLPPPNDPFTIARDTTPLLFEPGREFQYSNPGLAMLGYAITSAIKESMHKDLRSLLRERVMRPIGVADSEWSVGYGQTVHVDGLPLVGTWGGGNFTARAVARMGRLMLRKGNWEGQQLIAASAIEQVTTDAGTSGNGGMGWWSNNDAMIQALPKDSFWGAGAGHQVLLVIPSLNVIAVRNGETLNPSLKYDEALRKHFFEPLAQAVNQSPAPRVDTAAELGSNERPDYCFPPPESQGGWRKLDHPEDIRRMAGMDLAKLDALKEWLLRSDDRNFAAVVIRRGHIVLEMERGNSAKTDARRVASVSKAICATVLAIASEQSRQGRTPRNMKFDDPAFDFIPWAQPLSDPRKSKIAVKQLLNHTSGLCPEAIGAPNDGTWEYVLGHSGDARTAQLAFDPGTASGYSTHALHHASLVCETVTGLPYDRFAIQALFEPIGAEHWSFQYYEGGEKYGRHPSHGMGMPARDLARIAYCMLRGGRWKEKQIIPKWFVEETAAPTHGVQGPEMRFKINAQIFSHGWELPARLTGEGGRSGEGIPPDARHKPGSGGQLIAFVPSLDLVVTRQTGSSGNWPYEEYLRQACQAVLSTTTESK